MTPPISSTRRLVITRPIPVPSWPRDSCPRRLNDWNSCARFSGDIPGPVSLTLMRMRSGDFTVHSTMTAPPAWLYLMALESRLIRICFTRVRSASTKQGLFQLEKTHGNAVLLRLRLDHGLAIEHGVAERHGFQRQLQFAGLDHGEIEDLVDQVQQVPPRLENLAGAFLLSERLRRGVGFHQLCESEDRIERRAQLMAHVGKEIRFRPVGLFRNGPGVVQFHFDLLARGIVGADQ